MIQSSAEEISNLVNILAIPTIFFKSFKASLNSNLSLDPLFHLPHILLYFKVILANSSKWYSPATFVLSPICSFVFSQQWFLSLPSLLQEYLYLLKNLLYKIRYTPSVLLIITFFTFLHFLLSLYFFKLLCFLLILFVNALTRCPFCIDCYCVFIYN